MKKLILLMLCCTLVLTGCAGTTVVVGNCTCPPESHENVEVPTAAGTLKTGLAILPEVSGKNASAEENGMVTYDVTIVAVTVDERGIIRDCVIDALGAEAAFDNTGAPAATGITEVKTKNELGESYGMKKAGSRYEWNEQAQALADYAVGKTVAQLKTGAVDEAGKAKDADLATRASISLGDYVDGIEAAAANAKPLGGEAEHPLKLAVTASVDAAAGKLQLNLDAAALTMNGETITSCTIDSLQAAVEIAGDGIITSDLTIPPRTKNQLGFDYGMGNASQIGKEWFQQVEHFCAYVTGKTVAEVAGIQVNAQTKPEDVDLAAGCTISIGGFRKLIAKAAD